jgi:hypothetical protein
MLLHTAFTDEPTITATQLAQFDPFGNGYCNFTNGDLRYQKHRLEIFKIRFLMSIKICRVVRRRSKIHLFSYRYASEVNIGQSFLTCPVSPPRRTNRPLLFIFHHAKYISNGQSSSNLCVF